ncbi:hypothetical protein [Stakelama tenebrarum]|uniref:Uncharacterized protein n=1 Tax=Stakelama tenebrarum TaxID=2711215 RepID=A0A6G6Y5A5_9SPHN|nr:hypothetical protein [Sphingosinithalassobacter tenebrarum]QIG80079.1 hypothetical protein G5C33_10005 [Sphingosinithalassobacter tenebrarum]
MTEVQILPPLQHHVSMPPASTEAAILNAVVRAHPHCGNQLEAAVRMALRLGWAARHHWEGMET